MVVAQGLARVAAGLVLGVGTALLLTRFLEDLIFGIEPTDPGAVGLAVGGLAAVAAAGAYLPARRALRVDPVAALRTP